MIKVIKKFKTYSKNPYLKIIFIIFIIFTISSNRAWFSHRDNFKVVKIPEKIPFMWQYDRDASGYIRGAAYFPQYFEIHKELAMRPMFPMMSKLIGNIITVPLNPFLILGKLEKAAIGWVILSISLYFTSGIMMFKILNFYFSESSALLSIILLYCSSSSISAIGTFYPYELQFLTPIIAIFLFKNLAENYSNKKNILYSILFGIIMLARQNYAIYLAIILYSLYNKKYKEVIISFASHMVPLLFWIIYLEFSGIIGYLDWFKNTSFEDPGNFFVNEFLFFGPLQMIKIIFQDFSSYLSNLSSYSIFIYLAFGSLLFKKTNLERNIIIFSLIFITTNWMQYFFLYPGSGKGRHVLDISLIIYGLSGNIIMNYLKQYDFQLKKRIIVLISFIWLFYNFMGLVNFPWIHPYQQDGQPKILIDNWLDDNS